MFKKIEKFKRWMNYNPPEAETMEGWDNFEKEFKKNAPVRYYLVKDGFHIHIQNRIRWAFRDAMYAIRYSITKPDIVRTDLSRSYHDKPELMFHACFSLLVDFVEKECAHMHCWTGEKENRKILLGWKRFLPYWLRFSQSRNKQFGLEHLKWETELGDESPEQSKNAKEILELYSWYTDVRPNRVEPEYPEMPERDSFFSMFTEKWKEENPVAHEEFIKYCDETNKLEAEWHEEDNKMLERLVKVRDGLWT